MLLKNGQFCPFGKNNFVHSVNKKIYSISRRGVDCNNLINSLKLPSLYLNQRLQYELSSVKSIK